jgi:hypothetical protein
MPLAFLGGLSIPVLLELSDLMFSAGRCRCTAASSW